MLKVINWGQKDQWDSIVNTFLNKDIYFSYEYFESSLLLDEGVPIIFFFEYQNGRVAYPVVKRRITYAGGKELYDITTPYGYGGPLVDNPAEDKELLRRFREAINKYCIDNNVVSEFIRFHPILGNHINLDDYLKVFHIRNTIEIQLQKSFDLLAEIPGKTRNMVRKAMKNKIEIRKIDKDENLDDFLSIYYSTMNRNDATDFYYFKEEYFEKTFELLDSNLHLFGAFLGGEMISASLIFKYGDFMHYHLSGALKEHLSLGANNLLLFEMAEWGRKQGVKSFHLGGGYSGSEDSLYKFKKSFSKSEPLKFYIGKKIHSQNLYEMLVNDKEIREDNGFFPLYRS